MIPYRARPSKLTIALKTMQSECKRKHVEEIILSPPDENGVQTVLRKVKVPIGMTKRERHYHCQRAR